MWSVLFRPAFGSQFGPWEDPVAMKITEKLPHAIVTKVQSEAANRPGLIFLLISPF